MGFFGWCLLLFCGLIVVSAIVGGIMLALHQSPYSPTLVSSPTGSSNMHPSSLSTSPASNETSQPTGEGAFYAAQELIEKQLKAPSTAKFSKPNWDTKTGWEMLTTNRWKVGGFIDAQNAFSAMIRSDWLAIVDWTGTNYYLSYWRLGDQEAGVIPTSREDVQAFIAIYGTPDKEDTTAYDTPRPPMVSRFLIYESEHVRVLCIPDAKVGEPPPYKGWILIGFEDTRDDHVIKRPEVDERLKKRKKQ
jgi:hypothetical protein